MKPQAMEPEALEPELLSGQQFAMLLVELNESSSNPIESTFLHHVGFEYIYHERISKEEVGECLEQARRLQDKTSQPAEQLTKTKTIPLPIDHVISTERFFESIEESTKALRLEIFGVETAPFTNLIQAKDWIEAEESKQGEQSRDTRRGILLWRRTMNLRRALEKHFNRDVRLSIKFSLLEYAGLCDSGLVTRRAVVLKSNPGLRQLTAYVTRLSKLHKIDQVYILAFVLCDIRHIPPFQLKRSHVFDLENQVRRALAEIKISRPLPAKDDFLELYKYERRMRGGQKGFSKSNSDLIQVIKSVGKVPRPWERNWEYWEKVAWEYSRVRGERIGRRAVKSRFDRFRQEIRVELMRKEGESLT